MNLREIDTPALVLDRLRLERNIERMRSRAAELGVSLRPHAKTAKSAEIVSLACGSGKKAAITVASLNEAEYFAANGFKDVLYAVCVTPDKLDRAGRLIGQGVDLRLIVDSVEAAAAVNEAGAASGITFPVLVEVDSGEHRTGVSPDSEDLLAIAARLANETGARFEGVLTHAGQAYNSASSSEIAAVAEKERAAAVTAASRIRAAGIECRTVSVGSTPTAVFAAQLEGVTELRAGVYMFFDLFQAGLGVCSVEDIAISVLATVVSAKPGRIVVDAGGLALSKDTSRARNAEDEGFGRLVDIEGAPFAVPLRVGIVHQEHGEVDTGDRVPFKVGDRVRVLPNHACMTAAQHEHYHVVEGSSTDVLGIWPRTNGWSTYGQHTSGSVEPSA